MVVECWYLPFAMIVECWYPPFSSMIYFAKLYYFSWLRFFILTLSLMSDVMTRDFCPQNVGKEKGLVGMIGGAAAGVAGALGASHLLGVRHHP